MEKELVLNVYDFDKTIYDGDSSIDFYIFCIKKNPVIIFHLLVTVIYFILYKLKIISKLKFKERFFSFLKYIKEVDKVVEEFWSKNISKIKKWFSDDVSENKVIISASPEFLLMPLIDKLEITSIIASRVDKYSGKFLSENCYGQEKVKRLNEIYSNYKIKKFYSDSNSDIYLAKLAESSYLVSKNKIEKWNI